MPYPILKLPYGLQQRLRSFATPKERYYLQVAVGLEKNYFGSLQMCLKHSKCKDFRLEKFEHFQMDGGDGFSRNAESDNLFVLEGNLRIHDFEPSDYYDPFFDHFLIKSDAFLMDGMEHPDVPQKLAKLCDPNLVTYLKAGTCRSDVNLTLVVDNFNNIEFLDIEYPDYQSNWMLKLKNLKLTCLDIKSQFEKLFCFEPHELSQLYKNLPPTFRLILSCDNPPENASELVRQKFGPHFKEINSESRNTGGYDGFLFIDLHDYLCFEVIEQTAL